MTTGQKITELRKKNNITQEQLADLLSVSRQSVSKWESDLAYPETEKLISLSKIFQCSVDYLLKEEAQSSSDVQNIISPKEEKTPQQEESPKKTVINKRGLPFSITSFAFAIISLILFVIPIADTTVYVQGYGTVYITANFYQIVFSSSYALGNIFFLFDFLIVLAILALSVFYFFFHKKAICLSLKILTTCFAFFYFVALLIASNNADGAFYFLFILYVTYMIIAWSIKPFRFARKIKGSQLNSTSEKAEVIDPSPMVEMPQDESAINVNKTSKSGKINKKGWPLSITSMSFVVLTLILFFVPIIYVPYSGIGNVDINFYQIAFSSYYQAGNIFYTLAFLLVLSILAIGILYFFFDKRGLFIALKVLTTCFVFFYCLDCLFLANDAYPTFFIFALLYLAYMIIMWSIKPFRYQRKIK